MLWFCITTLCDWLTKLATLYQPMGIQTKTNRVLAARVCQLPVFVSNSDWLILLFSSVAIGQSKYFRFVFCDTQLETALSLVPRKSNSIILLVSFSV